ncbi:MAG: HU family DNA-binding protein [Alphaproteobacteria bacterium]|nr:HU family DNA-binding protein [Alphaproteobacteria bacterium]
MNKNEFISRVAKKGGMTKGVADLALDVILETIQDALVEGESVHLVGFGTFDITKRKATLIRNPRTGKEMDLPEIKTPRFRPGMTLRRIVR